MSTVPPRPVPVHLSILERNARHLVQLDRELRPVAAKFLARCVALGYPLVIVQSRRSDADQLVLFQKGRALLRGVWHVVNPKLVVTKASTASATAHGCVCGVTHAATDEGCAFAFDVCFAIDGKVVGTRPGKGNDSWDPDMPWRAIALVGVACGLTPGASFGESAPGTLDGWDGSHFELPGWRKLRAALPRGTPRAR